MAATSRRVPALLFPYAHTDAVAQIALWAGFALGYEAVRGLVVGTRDTAFANARAIVHLEQRLGGLPELHVQRAVLDSGGPLLHLVDWTYWLAQFGVLLSSRSSPPATTSGSTPPPAPRSSSPLVRSSTGRASAPRPRKRPIGQREAE